MAFVTISGYPSSGKSRRALELVQFLSAKISPSSYEGPFSTVEVISDDLLGIERSAYDESRSEKPARGALLTAVQRALALNKIIILDSLNYNKGFRYQLYCAARESKVRVCTLYVVATPDLCREWNSSRQDGHRYTPETLENLFMRYEEPSSMVRWDSPLFTVVWSDESLPNDSIWEAITKGNIKPPNSGTLNVAKAPSDALHTLEQTTTAMVSSIMAEQAAGQSMGGSISLTLNGGAKAAVCLPARNITLSELQRLKRQFVTIHRKAITLGTTEKGSVGWEEESIAQKFGTIIGDRLAALSLSRPPTMPLPTDTTLGLMGFSRPGETSQSRPKQAMLIRMSDKTLDLLESSPQLHFDFSESPGITIGDTFFPVNSVAETTPHEIYLRASSQAKPNAPLKLYANVTGRFVVERQLDDRISDKVRNSNLDAQNQRAGRTTIFVKTPTDLPPPNGKKKEGATSTMFRKRLRPADQPRRSLATTNNVTSVNTTPAPQPSQRSKEALQALRNRMIPCICTSQRTSEQIVKLVGGNNCSTTARQDILRLLDEIAELIPLPTNSKSPKTYRLKTESWLEVRPYEIPGLSETERINLARSAKYALRDLKIPESDPAWSHVQYRNPNGTSSSSTSRKQPPNAASSSRSGQLPEPKRGITSGATKDKKPKAKDNGEIMMKNESREASNSKTLTNNSNRDDDDGKSSPFKPPVPRRPGSGFQKAKQLTPTESQERSNGRSPIINGKAFLGEPSSGTQKKPSGSTHAAERRSAGMPSQKINKLRRDDVAISDSERSDVGREREQEKANKAKDRAREDKERERRELANERERERERDKRDLERLRENERPRKREVDMDGDRRIKKRARDAERLQEREEGEHSDDSYRQQKRKKPRREDDGTEATRVSVKKRKVESPSFRDRKAEELGLPKKPDTELIERHKIIKKESSPFPSISKVKKEGSPLVLPAKIKKEPSPLTSLPKIKKEPASAFKIASPVTKASPAASTSSSHPASSKQKVSTKRRRGSDIYTSTEDEGEVHQGAKREPISHATINNNIATHTNKPPPAHDRAALRNHYDSSYLPYLDKFQVLMSQKPKLRNLLKKVEKSGSDSVTESEGDGELLEPEELRKLALEYQDQHGDLENIQRIFSKRDDRSEL